MTYRPWHNHVDGDHVNLLTDQFDNSYRIEMRGSFPWISEKESDMTNSALVFADNVSNPTTTRKRIRKNDNEKRKKMVVGNQVVMSLPFDQYRSASILPYYINDSGEKLFFVGKERRGWSDFGGGRENEDLNPLMTAIREFIEETRGQLTVPSDIRQWMTFDQHVIYTGQLQLPNNTISAFNGSVPDLFWLDLHDCSDDIYIEKMKYGWIFESDIRSAIKRQRKRGSISVRGLTSDGWETMFLISSMSNILRCLINDNHM